MQSNDLYVRPAIPVGSDVVRSVGKIPAEPVAHGAAHDQLEVAALSQGISLVNIVTHSFHEHGTRVMSVKLFRPIEAK